MSEVYQQIITVKVFSKSPSILELHRQRIINAVADQVPVVDMTFSQVIGLPKDQAEDELWKCGFDPCVFDDDD